MSPPNLFLVLIVGLLLLDFVLELVVETLNLRRARDEIPEEFRSWYDEKSYARSQAYLRERTRFSLVKSGIVLPVTLAFILFGGFGLVDEISRSAGFGMIPTGLLFTGLLVLAATFAGLPFRIYSTFVLEERYGFNRTTPRTFVTDTLKGLLLSVAIGAPVLAGVLWFFSRTGSLAWFYTWVALTVVQFLLAYVAPVTIFPLFNKFTPLEAGDLREAIERYARSQDVPLRGVFKIDGSRRSTKSNAFFTGFGRWKRIALFDTLMEKHEPDEIVAVLAHEAGHFKLGHILQGFAVGVAFSGVMLFLLSFFITVPGLYDAFSVSTAAVRGDPPVYAGLVFFGFLFSPISSLMSIFGNWLSRRNEYGADAFAVRTTGRPEDLVRALKKLSVDNLSNLEPHPLKVILEHGHPPVLARIRAIRAL